MKGLNHYNSRQLKAGVIAILIGFALLATGLFVFPPALLFFAIPYIVYSAQYKVRYAGIAIAVSGLFLMSVVDIPSAVTLAGIALFFSWYYPGAYAKQTPSYQAIFVGTSVLLVVMLGINWVMEWQMNTGLITQTEATLREAITRQIEIFESSGLSTLQIVDLEFALRSALNRMVQVIPGMLFLMSFLMALAHYSGSAWVLRFRGYGIMDAGRFNRFRLPSNILIGAAMTFLATYLMGLAGFRHTETLYLNLLLIFSVLFFTQGLAVVDLFVAKRFNIITRLILPAFLILFLQMGFAFILIGILDVPFKFRDRITYKRGD